MLNYYFHFYYIQIFKKIVIVGLKWKNEKIKIKIA
jgi:hypothetical protein